MTPVIAEPPVRVLHADLDPAGAWIDQLFEPPSDARWLLLTFGAQPGEEQDTEARLAIGNGAFGMRDGRPAEVITHEAFHRHMHLIAMGTHGRIGLARLALGSVARETLRKTPVPVLLVRR